MENRLIERLENELQIKNQQIEGLKEELNLLKQKLINKQLF